MLFKFKNCLALIRTITQFEIITFIVCDHCFLSFHLCICMKDHLKCTEYTYHDCFCVSVSLNFLNCVHKRLKFQLNETETEYITQLETFQQLNFKILQLQKTIKQNKLKVIKKTNCVAAELDDDNNETENETDSFNIQQLINSMLSFF